MFRRVVGEAAGLGGDLGRLGTAAGAPEQAAPATPDPPRPRPVAAGATRTPEIAEVEALVAEAGLADRVEHVRRLLVPSVRLVRREGDTVDPAAGTAWRVEDAAGAPVLEVSAPRIRDLTCVRARPASPSPPAAPYAVRAGRAGDVSGEGLPLQLSTELVLPRAWSSAVQGLGLGREELDAWEALRGRLAALHGLAPPDVPIGSAPIHRVLGYADETTGSMPIACAMLAGGVDLGDTPPFAHPKAERFEQEATGWRLLLQLSRDETLGWSWGPRDERLYVWIHQERLASESFERSIALVQ